MALNCKLEKSILKENFCGYSLNSVKTIYLANKNDITAIERAVPSGSTSAQYGTEVKTITLEASAKWAKIEPSTNSASFSDSLNTIDGGGKYRTHTLNFSIAGEYTPEMVDNLDNLSLGEFVAVAELASGTMILLGSESVGLVATNVTNTGSGSATEFSGIQVEMSADLTVSAAPLSAEAIAALKEKIAE